MSLAHVVESAIGTGVAMVAYQGARKVAARIALFVVMRRLNLTAEQLHGGNASRAKSR